MGLSKPYWIIKNHLQVAYFKATGIGSGLLSHRKDPRDHIADLGWFMYQPQHETLSMHNGKIFDQDPFNICVFASRVMGSSLQQKVDFSVRWDVIVAKRNKMITGDGWSYLRAENDIAYFIGRLPAEFLPSEINGMTWEEYTTISDSEYERLKLIAAKYKTKYKKVTNVNAALAALDKGFVLFTAAKWYSGDTDPMASAYIIKHTGTYLGGHALYVTGYKPWENPQTFGMSYGKEGVVYLEELFGKNNYEIYIEEFIN